MRKLRYLIGKFIGVLGYTFFKGSFFKTIDQKNFILSIYFHNPTKDCFSEIIHWLKENDFYFLTIEELALEFQGLQVTNKRRVFLSIDDGWIENRENVFDTCASLKIPILLFLAPDACKKGKLWIRYLRTGKKNKEQNAKLKALNYAERNTLLENIDLTIFPEREIFSIEMVREISRNNPHVYFGSHTFSHPILNKCTYIEQDFEINEGHKLLQECLEIKAISFAYPNGDYNDETLQILKRSEVKFAFNTKPKLLDLNSCDSLEIPRICITDSMSKMENLSRIVGGWNKIFRS